MILDSKLVVANNVSLASVTTSNAYPSGFNLFQIDAVKNHLLNNASANAINLNSAINDMGRIGKAMLCVDVGGTALLAGSSAGTLIFKLAEKSAAASFASATAVMEVGRTGSIATSAASNADFAVAKPLIRTQIPANIWGTTTNKFIGVLVAMSAGKIASGTVSIWIGFPEVNNLKL